MLSPKTNATAGIGPGPILLDKPWIEDIDIELSASLHSVATAGTVTEGSVYEIHDAGDYDPAIKQHVVDNSVIIEVVADGTVMGYGSGFFLDGRLIATANHVVPTREELIDELQNAQEQDDPANWEYYDKRIDLVKSAKKFVYRVTPSGGDQAGESFVVEVGARDAASDLAVLDLKSPTDYTGLTFAPEGSVKPQDDFWITGLTGGNFPGQTVDAEVIAVDPEVIPPKLEALRKKGFVLEDIIVAEALTFGGISGGVGWNAKGEVVGVVSWGKGGNLIVLIRSEKLNELKERYQQKIRENSMASESAEDGLSAWFMDVFDELPDINDIEGILEHLAANPPIDPMEILREAEAFGAKVDQAQDLDSLLQLWQDTLGTQPDSLSSVDWDRGLAVGKAFADLLAGGPGTLGGPPGSIGGPIGGIEVELELEPGVELPFG